jgi:hypothetical protein
MTFSTTPSSSDKVTFGSVASFRPRSVMSCEVASFTAELITSSMAPRP